MMPAKLQAVLRRFAQHIVAEAIVVAEAIDVAITPTRPLSPWQEMIKKIPGARRGERSWSVSREAFERWEADQA